MVLLSRPFWPSSPLLPLLCPDSDQPPKGTVARNAHRKDILGLQVKEKRLKVFKISLLYPRDQRASRWESKCWGKGWKFALELRTDGVEWAGPQVTATSPVERSEGLGILEILTSFQPALRILAPVENQDYIERDSLEIWTLFLFVCLFWSRKGRCGSRWSQLMHTGGGGGGCLRRVKESVSEIFGHLLGEGFDNANDWFE